MKVLLTGAGGQLGWELQRWAPPSVALTAVTRTDLDIGDAAQVMACVERYQPDWIINAAAYTAVDKAEAEPALAHRVNAAGAEHLAAAARAQDCRLLHISTDFVFDGAAGTPRQPDDPVNPLGVYGESKQQGERAVQRLLGSQALIVRTAWVYSSHGDNFVKTMLRLMNERDSLGVVDDQLGTPTWAAELAKVLFRVIDNDLRGVWHWTDAGVASWYDFAVAIHQLGREQGLIGRDCQIRPISTEAYPLPAPRPANAVLDKQGLREAIGYDGLHWREGLKHMLEELSDV